MKIKIKKKIVKNSKNLKKCQKSKKHFFPPKNLKILKIFFCCKKKMLFS